MICRTLCSLVSGLPSGNSCPSPRRGGFGLIAWGGDGEVNSTKDLASTYTSVGSPTVRSTMSRAVYRICVILSDDVYSIEHRIVAPICGLIFWGFRESKMAICQACIHTRNPR